ncbi:hypothetical protein H6P81_008996 [Aristolochia fimbriata]|uniref:Uncharacterized protein n=1 Tax=Aristolochia fimbriata TaxID=158543 RepID=A0AAV7EKU3_ARIFI|nr:hypothetical protein H6P81_008996 [Aristolochia fimbriata]
MANTTATFSPPSPSFSTISRCSYPRNGGLLKPSPKFNSQPISVVSTSNHWPRVAVRALQQDGAVIQTDKVVAESVKVLKNAAKTRKVPAEEVLSALDVIKKAKIDPSPFLDTLGGTESPGRTWMLIFTAQGRLERGSYFPVTAVQRFDAAAKRIENGVYLGAVGCLTFEGRFSWMKRRLAFVFEYIKIKIGPFGPLQINLGKADGKEPTTKDPFFIWFYIDEEIAVAQGRGGGTAFWCRCRRQT